MASIHGTISTYSNRRCRCELCRTAWAFSWAMKRRDWLEAGLCIRCGKNPIEGSTRHCTPCLETRRLIGKTKRMLEAGY